jgi:hypothetical protein
MAVRLFCYVPARYLFAFGLYDLSTAEVQVAFTLETKSISTRKRFLGRWQRTDFI